MIGEIISVGDELLEGHVLNTNSQYLSQQLFQIGINVKYQQTIGDDFDSLVSAFNNSLNRSDVIILTGGLGPTRDDITKEAVSRSLNLNLLLDENEYQRIKSFFDHLQKRMSENNKKQAYIPEGAEVLINQIGTAPGIFIEQEDKIVAMLPGPPREMKTVFLNELKPRLIKNITAEGYYKSSIIKLIGIGESQVDEIIKEIKIPNCEIVPLALRHQVHLILKSYSQNQITAEEQLKRLENMLQHKLSSFIWGRDDDKLEEIVVNTLKDKGLSLAVAESMTGGLIAGKLTDVSGASNVFHGGVVAYTEDAKLNSLTVSQKVLEKYSHVSEETSYELAKQIREKFNTDIGLGITGYAGPEGERVGLFHTVIVGSTGKRHLSRILPGGRTDIKKGAVIQSLNELRKFLSD
ncbi:competence/damage-inducible protein A [Natranaerobius thermophilus]|uniref:Putative competence-damage inducible protein n=1 Tax=Natranaerobius thermophilus (strain ATCC BAA-1301 / DSM 18059 / JW/NM-WN-LF) TaxID=457570 RepID=CINA_NATTJ|nr:competence/damage-inducible protein A [Natranaerobius thermophilus]B2A3C4.1 RecName: Full=Putative competence-damage inducible protein [Natranaerobius thermophilus JW/NM-WN-LF]ACB85054.1 competence/damage-inducible protein CinA [Natranaerobius thermophilus JW/NM-WN-LF]